MEKITVKQWESFNLTVVESAMEGELLEAMAENEGNKTGYFYHHQTETCVRCGYFCEC